MDEDLDAKGHRIEGGGVTERGTQRDPRPLWRVVSSTKKTTPGQMGNPKMRANITAEKGEDHRHTFYARLTLRMPQSNSVGDMALMMVADLLKILQARDLLACVINPADGGRAYGLKDLPKEWVDFYDDWLSWEDRIDMWANTIRDGKLRFVRGTFMIGCNWKPEDLIRKVKLKLQEKQGRGGTIAPEYKET